MKKLFCSHRSFLQNDDDLKEKPFKGFLVHECSEIVVWQGERTKRFYEIKKGTIVEPIKETVEEIKRPEEFEEVKPEDIFF